MHGIHVKGLFLAYIWAPRMDIAVKIFGIFAEKNYLFLYYLIKVPITIQLASFTPIYSYEIFILITVNITVQVFDYTHTLISKRL